MHHSQAIPAASGSAAHTSSPRTSIHCAVVLQQLLQRIFKDSKQGCFYYHSSRFRQGVALEQPTGRLLEHMGTYWMQTAGLLEGGKQLVRSQIATSTPQFGSLPYMLAHMEAGRWMGICKINSRGCGGLLGPRTIFQQTAGFSSAVEPFIKVRIGLQQCQLQHVVCRSVVVIKQPRALYGYLRCYRGVFRPRFFGTLLCCWVQRSFPPQLSQGMKVPRYRPCFLTLCSMPYSLGGIRTCMQKSCR